MDEHLKELLFRASVNSPGSWLVEALSLRQAADLIGPTAPSRLMMFPIYRFLLGMSVENLLKGIAVAHGANPTAPDGKLTKPFKSHRVSSLPGAIDRSRLPISKDERKTLERLEGYVVWAGRYPLPTCAEHFSAKTATSEELAAERDLWDRLYDHLVQIGWIEKIDGHRLDTKNL